MPYLNKSWRSVRRLKWISRLLCLFGKHYWLHSTYTKRPLICAECQKHTEFFDTDDL